MKPSFVFHVFLEVTLEDRRRMNAEGAFSTQNYRTYSFRDERQHFLLDLIAHHRAITAELNLVNFAYALDDAVWDAVDRHAVFSHVARGSNVTVAELARISVDTLHLQDALARAAISGNVTDLPEGDLSFTGTMFRWPLLLGLRAYELPDQAAKAFKELSQWQESPEEFIFHPARTNQNLSQDFDFAITELAPPMFCLVAMLFSREPGAARALCTQLLARATDGRLNNPWKRYALLWCAIAGVKVGADDVAEQAIASINELGGLPSSVPSDVPSPTGSGDSDDGSWEGILASLPSSPVSLALFKERLATVRSGDDTPEGLVAELLADDEMLPSLARRLISLAW